LVDKVITHYRHPVYDRWLTQVNTPCRYAGCEFGAIRKDPHTTPHRMVLVFPDLYEIGMSHMGLRILYELINTQPDLACERAFMVDTDMETELRRRRLELVSLENAQPLRSFALIGFSLQYELTYTNCLAVLALSNIALRARDRTPQDPLIVGGGPVATHPEPMAPFFDLFLIGEAEELLPTILRQESTWRGQSIARAERLKRFAAMEHCYVPRFHPAAADQPGGLHVVHPESPAPRLARWAAVDRLGDGPSALQGPIPCREAVFDRISLEIMRGCTQGCRFCQAGSLYRPIRERTPQEIGAQLNCAVTRTGCDEVSLTALSPADHSHLLSTFRRAAHAARPQNISLSVSSLRAYGLDGALLDDLRTGRGGGLTFAPEGGTQRMRNVVNKNVSEADLLYTAREVARRGWDRIKLYFMIGLPTETDGDLEAIIRLGCAVEQTARQAAPKRAPRVTISVSTFVPKPHTALQWAPMSDLAEIRRKQAVLKKRARGKRVSLRFHEPHTSVLEAILSRGDRRLAAVIEDAFKAGCRFDSWEEALRWKDWRAAFDAHALDPNDYLAARTLDARLCWDHIRVPVAPQYLKKEYHRAHQARTTPPCGEPDAHNGTIICHHCGANCNLEAIQARFVPAKGDAKPPPSAPQVKRLDANRAVSARLIYQKTGPAVLWGHLALLRHLPRTLRRAGLAVQYSAGFHPKPLLHYAPPLPLGWRGLFEPADVQLETWPADDDETRLAKLNAGAPEGLIFLHFERLDKNERALSKVLAGATYAFALGPFSTHSASEVEQRIAAFMAAPRVLKNVTRKKGRKEIDFRRPVRSLDWYRPSRDAQTAKWAKSGWSKSALKPHPAPYTDQQSIAATTDPVLIVELSMQIGGGGPRPLELLYHLVGEVAWVQVTRVRFWADDEARLL
jgi:radical SAM family uncharacterized protein/radical SAM-linked protein